MIPQPQYFERVQQSAIRRWEQLEADPDLAAPWHQLFSQVQSPRHVLSELLQNADDAGATETFATIEDGVFLFRHNGEDFTEEHFQSLCRFGYSNKRALHTIGFRGIGFKSTFSLGDRVELASPTLAVAFERRRFTQPVWLPNPVRTDALTEIRVPIRTAQLAVEIEKNLMEWFLSPLSLLFFKHIRRLHLIGHDLHWGSMGPGPVAHSEWMALHAKPDEPFLLVRSAFEDFPDLALGEIEQERMIHIDQEQSFPPSRVEIVIGVPGRLYVVLPTGITTDLPFAINAPFIQDPARLKIKEPDISPTNDWLLKRAGRLAASAMTAWLENKSASVRDRADAYDFLPVVQTSSGALEGQVARTVSAEFDRRISGRPLVLITNGDLVPAGEAVVVPDEIAVTWPSHDTAKLFDSHQRPAVATEISRRNKNNLLRRELADEIDVDKLIASLEQKRPPSPPTWKHLLGLWAYLQPHVISYRYTARRRSLNIVPTRGSEDLFSTNEVSRLGEKRLLQSDDDWDFLSKYLRVLHPNWTRYLATQRREAEEQGAATLRQMTEAAYALLKSLGLEETSDADKVIAQVAHDFFSSDEAVLKDCVRLAQIAAKLGANAGNAFKYRTVDEKLRPTTEFLVGGERGRIEHLLPPDWASAHLLHSRYTASFTSCSREDWDNWVSAGKASLLSFVPLTAKRERFWTRGQLKTRLAERGYDQPPSYQFVTDDFIFTDWDFPEIMWTYWNSLAEKDPRMWGEIVVLMLQRPEDYSIPEKGASISQIATTGNVRTIASGSVTPAWIMKLREVESVPDTHGTLHKPPELVVRSAETEPFRDVEVFVHAGLDTAKNRSLLLALGVREKPIGLQQILSYLRGFASSTDVPLTQIVRWCDRLDEIAANCSTGDFEVIKAAFRNERLILTQDLQWSSARGVFLDADDLDTAGVPVVHRELADLSLWRKVGVADHPTVELLIKWIKQFSSERQPNQDESRRLRSLMARYPVQIWDECGHWFNLNGQWVASTELSYSLTMQGLVTWSHLYDSIKAQTADLQRVSVEVAEALPFCKLLPLGTQIEERLLNLNPVGAPGVRPWLRELGGALRRVDDSTDDIEKIRSLGAELVRSKWQTVSRLVVGPYIDGTPAGTTRTAEVAWFDGVVYAMDRPMPRLAKSVAAELGRFFKRNEIVDAVKICFERPAEFVAEYMEENFNLLSAVELASVQDAPGESRNTREQAHGGPAEKSSEVESTDGEFVSARHGTAVREIQASNGDAPNQAHQSPNRRTSEQARSKPSLIELFARSKGFTRINEDTFVGPADETLRRLRRDLFDWELAIGGEVLARYLIVGACLDKVPVEIDSEIWSAMQHSPSSTALILEDSDGLAVEFTGSKLLQLRERKQLHLYPAQYRIVLETAE